MWNIWSGRCRALWLACWMIIGMLHSAMSQLTCVMVPGDANQDNAVDDADLLTCLQNFGTSATNSDFNGDGTVDDADLLTCLTNFGQSGASPFSGTREVANGNVVLSIRVTLQGYRNDGISVPVVLEAQKMGSSVVYRQQTTLFSNPDVLHIAVPEPGRYRVQVSIPDGVWLRSEVDTNDAFNIVNLQSGQTVEGEVSVRLELPFRFYEYADVMMSVDNQPVDWAGDIILPFGRPAVLMTIPTNEFANGIHIVTVSDIYNHSRSIVLNFQNRVFNVYVEPIFEPFSLDSEMPSSCRIRADLAQQHSWEVRILTIDNPPFVVNSFRGTGLFIDIVWNGTNSLGIEVENGVYEVEFVIDGIQLQQKKKTNKNRGGEVFILLETDKSIFPGGESSWKEYLRFIKGRLSLVGPPYDSPSVIVIDSRDIAKPSIENSSVAKRINEHFSRRLQLFYVNSHGGNSPKPFFGIGPYTWYSTIPDGQTARGRVSFDMSEITRNVGYGRWVDPPALVWIDACRSAGSAPDGNIGSDDFSFKSAVFKSGELQYGVFLGWNGVCFNYGALAPPNDCWTFWRRQFWIEITSGRNFGTALSRTDTLTRNRGFGDWVNVPGVPNATPNDRRRMVGEYSSSL